jgi:PTH1 family peptidyl-tRNA hydrolase
VYDDADLELGRIRIRSAGSAGGHNGLRSLVGALREEGFPRVRLGVRGARRESSDLVDYVLEPFDADEEPLVDDLIERGADAVELILSAGLAAAMNRFNARGPAAAGPSEPH